MRCGLPGRRSRPSGRRRECGGEEGNAAVEFVFLGVLLLVPVVYLVLSVGAIQGASYAAAGAAEHAARSYAQAAVPEEGEAAGRQAAAVTLADFGFGVVAPEVSFSCADASCLEAGGYVTARVAFQVPLPLIGALPGMEQGPVEVSATSTQRVERYR